MSIHVSVGRRSGSRLATTLVDLSFHHYFGTSISLAVSRRSDGRLATMLVELSLGPVCHGVNWPRTFYFDKKKFN